MKFILLLFFSLSQLVIAKQSQCFGSTSNGRIEESIQLPIKGDNYRVYHQLGNFLGRNYVHSQVYNVVVNSYAELAQSNPNIEFMYGETGWKGGGKFKPHKTHQNGLSVDFMVPVIDANGISKALNTSLSNKFGYGLEFDEYGKYSAYVIDFEAIALHLVALHKESIKQNSEIRRVIFAPELQKKLLQTSQVKYLKENINFMKNKAWVRHDEHYHVDFKVNCKN